MHAHPAVAEVAVIGAASDRWGETPLAIVVTRQDADVDPHGLVEWTNRRVGRQQRVSKAVFVSSLPRNPNGKILKRELRAQYVNAAMTRGEAR